MKTALTIATTALFAASAASAQGDFFAQLDADGNGELTLQEIQAAQPNVTANLFGHYDTDSNGALTEAEFGVWLNDLQSGGQAGAGDDSAADDAE